MKRLSAAKRMAQRPRRMPPSVHGPTAFTLMELLVTISIIAVLAAMGLQAMGLMRAQARVATCRSNIRQLQLANIAYATDNEGFYVPAWSTDAATAYDWNYNWTRNAQFLDLFTAGAVSNGDGSKVAKQLLCPLARNLAPSLYFDVQLSYGINTYPLNRAGNWPSPANFTGSIQCNAFSQPDRIAFGDARAHLLDPFYAAGYYTLPTPEGTYMSHEVAYRHGSRAVCVMFDGHVESMTLNDLTLNWGRW